MWQLSQWRIHKFLYRLLTGFMVVWLALFYSALCEYHGLMLPFGPSHMERMRGMEHMHDDSPATSMAMPAHHASMAMQMDNWARSNGGKNDLVIQFSHVPLGLVAMSFLTIAAPTSFNLKPVQKHSSRVVADAYFTHQCSLFPPEQPPRFLPCA